MTLSDISIKNPVFAWMLMASLIIFGLIADVLVKIYYKDSTNYSIEKII